jgi:hypothetical protein
MLNLITLSISDLRVSREFEQHVTLSQNKPSLFYMGQVINAFNLLMQAYNFFFKGSEILGLLSAVVSIFFGSLLWSILRWRAQWLCKYNFCFFWLALVAVNLLGAFKVSPDEDSVLNIQTA